MRVLPRSRGTGDGQGRELDAIGPRSTNNTPNHPTHHVMILLFRVDTLLCF
jgi:hypothetical protein